MHNPVSNLRLGSGVMPFRAMLDRGIPVALGVDEAICDDAVNMWTVVKIAGLIHNVSGLDSDDWPTPAEVLDACGAAARGDAAATTSARSRPACSPTWRWSTCTPRVHPAERPAPGSSSTARTAATWC